MSIISKKGVPLVLLIACVLLTATIYGHSLGGPFLFDDQQNIVDNIYVQPKSLSWQALQAAAAAYPGVPGRPVATISFALSYWFNGLDPAAFKAANLLIHLLGGLALFRLSHLLLRTASEISATALNPQEQYFAASVAASLWLLHPLQVSTVLYAVQRMAILASLFSLLGLWAYVAMRRAQLRGRLGLPTFVSLILCLMLGGLSKEIGLLLPLLCGVTEASLFRFKAGQPQLQRLIASLWLGSIALTATCFLAYLPEVAHWVQAGYSGREFTLSERLLTQPRVLLLYLKLLLLPNVGEMTLYHDDFPTSKNWWEPADTWPAVLAVAGLAAATIAALVGRHRLLGLGLSLFLVGHLLESTAIALEMIFEHRNYLPSAGLFFALSVQMTSVIRGGHRTVVAVIGLTLLALLCNQRAQLFANPFALVKFTLEHHPESLRTQLWVGDTYRGLALRQSAEQRGKFVALALPHYQKAASLDAYDAIGLFQVLELQAMVRQPLDSEIFSELARRLNEGPVRVGTIVATQSFLNDIVKGTHHFPADEALALARLLLANPRCTGRGRAIVLSSAATVESEIFQNFDAAITYSREASKLQPLDPSLWIPHAAILFKAGQLSAAEQAVLSALAVDKGMFHKPLTDLLATIRAQSSNELHPN